MSLYEVIDEHISEPAIGGDAEPIRVLNQTDELVIPRHRSVITQYTSGHDANRELRLYYGSKEISFDEADLFAFGEALGKQSRFAAGSATSWGNGYEWPRVRGLLQQLIDEGVLHHAQDAGAEDQNAADPFDRLSPLPPAESTTPRTWFECERVMADFAGRSLEMGHLELVIPIFRVAHMSLDADGRQVGEANVFPKAARLDVPTQWRTCSYSGSRYQADRPMNVTALKAMRTHWGQMMAALKPIRAAYIARFPDAQNGWTVGHLERLSTAVLAVPTYLLMRNDQPLANGHLHPALSCLFRVTDGLRMVMHQMLFVPIGEPTLAPDQPITSAEIFAYAERNYSFHSEHGVCAGPQGMIQEFLAVLIDGASPKYGSPDVLEPEVEAALTQIEPALDYALLGLEAYAAVFSLWPAMTRTYETLSGIADVMASSGAPAAVALRDRFSAHIARMRAATYLGEETLRVEREAVYDDMYAQCALGLTGAIPAQSLRARLAPLTTPSAASAETALRVILQRHFGTTNSKPTAVLDDMVACLMEFFLREQSVLQLASEIQREINDLLGRATPVRPFDSHDIDLHNRLQGNQERRLPYLLDELEEVFGARIAITENLLGITDVNVPPQADVSKKSAGMVPFDPRAQARIL